MTRDHQHNPDVSLKCGIRSVGTGASIRGRLGKPRANLREGLLALLLAAERPIRQSWIPAFERAGGVAPSG